MTGRPARIGGGARLIFARVGGLDWPPWTSAIESLACWPSRQRRLAEGPQRRGAAGTYGAGEGAAPRHAESIV